MPRTCILEDWPPPVSVDLLEDMTKEELLDFRAFEDWLTLLKASLALQKFEDHALHKTPYKLRHIECQATDQTHIEPKQILFLLKSKHTSFVHIASLLVYLIKGPLFWLVGISNSS